MSSSASATPSQDSTPSKQSQEPQQQTFRNSSNLYLVTFLATLFLLLFISCAIVFRSFVVRRRFQRRLDEALAAGVVFAPRSQGGRRRRFGAKPKFFTSWVTYGGSKWDEIMPLSALPIQAKRRSRHSRCLTTPRVETTPTMAPTTAPTDAHPSRPRPQTRSTRLRRFFGHHEDNDRQRDNIDMFKEIERVLNQQQQEKPPTNRIDLLQVSVLIAMPTPPKHLKSSRESIDSIEEPDGDVIPEVVFGVTRLPYQHSNLQPLQTST